MGGILKLTIGIPTYNRANLLQGLLQDISLQIRQVVNFDVDILVSDNASTDHTEEIVKLFAKNNPDISLKFHRNKSNLGYDKNVNMLFQLASGDYVMTLSDDDGIESGAIDAIGCALAQNKHVKIVYIANSFYDCNLEKRINIDDPFFKNIGGSRYFQTARDLFLSSREVFGGISGLCIERKSWIETNVGGYFGTNWIHLGVTLNILKHADIFVITEPLIKYRLDNKEFRWSSLETSLGIQRILMEYYPIFPDVIRGIYNEHRHQTRLSLIYLDRSKSCMSKKEILLAMKMAFNTKKISFWIVDIPLLYSPSAVLKWSYMMYLRTKLFLKPIKQSS